MKQAGELKGQTFLVIPRNHAGFSKYVQACPYCGKESSASIGNFKNGAKGRTLYKCEHFKGWMSREIPRTTDNGWDKECYFIFMPEKKGKKVKK